MDANELLGAKTPMASDLAEGVKTLALNQKIPFKLYGRVVLPLDGWIFWVRADLLAVRMNGGPSPSFQTSGLVTASELSKDEMATRTFEATGSLHYTADTRQEEAESYSANRVVFTSTEEVQPLNDIAPGTMYIGEFDGLRFGFSSLSMRYQQAGLWHYTGFAIYPDIGPNVIDSVWDFSSAQVVSNSLPAWLAIAAYQPPWKFWGALPTLFPSFLVPSNEPPPFASVHIEPSGTRALASAPTIDPHTSTHIQLASDVVRITLWGARNFNAMDFVDAVYNYSEVIGAIGIMNTPIVADEKRTQSELNVIAMKKTITWEVSYLQNQMRAVAQKFITSAVPSIYVDGRKISPLP